MRAKPLPLYLDAALYARLSSLAEEQDRDPIQQARYLLKQALSTGPGQGLVEHNNEAVAIPAR